MRAFPDYFSPTNIKQLKTYRKNRLIAFLRRYIYESMLDEKFSIPDNCGIDLQNVPSSTTMGGYFIPTKDMIEQIVGELQNNGFATTLAFGGSMLFVHTKDEIPPQAIGCKTIE